MRPLPSAAHTTAADSRALTPCVRTRLLARRARGAADTSRPQLRSLAAVSFIHNSLHNHAQPKAATVHAGSAYFDAAAASAAAAAAAAQRGAAPAASVLRPASLDLPPIATRAVSAAGTAPPRRDLAPQGDDDAAAAAAAADATPPWAATPSPPAPPDDDAQPEDGGGAARRQSEEMTLIAHMPMPQTQLSVSPPARQPLPPGWSASTQAAAAAAAAATSALIRPPQQPHLLATAAPAGSGSLASGPPSSAAGRLPSLAGGASAGGLGSGSIWDLAGAGGPKRSEGSGHALQHYAFLLAAGERSLHGLSSRASMHRSLSNAVLHAGPAAGAGAVAAAGGGGPQGTTPPSYAQPPPAGPWQQRYVEGGSTPGAVGAGAGATPMSLSPHPTLPGIATPPPGGVGGGETAGQLQPGGSPLHYTVHGVSDVRRLLSTVQRQRREHRKLQRLMLDTSGHAEDMYAEVLRAQEQQQQQQGGEQHPGGAGAAAAGSLSARQVCRLVFFHRQVRMRQRALCGKVPSGVVLACYAPEPQVPSPSRVEGKGKGSQSGGGVMEVDEEGEEDGDSGSQRSGGSSRRKAGLGLLQQVRRQHAPRLAPPHCLLSHQRRSAGRVCVSRVHKHERRLRAGLGGGAACAAFHVETNMCARADRQGAAGAGPQPGAAEHGRQRPQLRVGRRAGRALRFARWC